MSQPTPESDLAVGRPAPTLRPLVSRYLGYRYVGFPPGTHLGLPSRHLTVVLSLGPPTRVAAPQQPGQAPVGYQALISGLDTRPALICHDGFQYGVQLELTPAGARSLLGMPAGALAHWTGHLESVLGKDALALVERMAAQPGWPERFAILDAVLTSRVGRWPPAAANLVGAWRAVVGSDGRLRVGALADEIGWSRRHLGEQFRAEYGVSVKEAARVVRFERSRHLLRLPGRPGIAIVAALCGYYDQAHLTREWQQLAGRTPSAWLATETLPAVAQDGH